MGHSLNPQAYPPEMAQLIMHADREGQVLEIPCRTQRERVSRALKWPALAKALRHALTKDRDLFTEQERLGMQEVLGAWRRLKLQFVPGDSPNFRIGPAHLMQRDWEPPRNVTAEVVATRREEAEPSEAMTAILEAVKRRKDEIQAGHDAIAHIARGRAAGIKTPVEPPPPARQASPEEVAASRAAAMAQIHKARMNPLTPHARAAYMLEHGVNAMGAAAPDSPPTPLAEHAPTKIG